jgi:uncharacterized SAM-binding protein YcdF (DUF218 family)
MKLTPHVGAAGAGRSRLLRSVRLAIILLILWSLIAWVAARWLVVRAELAHADAIVILSGSALYAERAQWAAHLYHEGRVPRLILTHDEQLGGWGAAEERNLFTYERSLKELGRSGVPPDKIEVLLQPVSSTYDEAVLLRGYAVSHGLRSLLFVTSGQHSRRALWTLRRVFQASGIEIGLSPAPPGPRSPSAATWWLLPIGWRIVAGEYLKIVYYRLKYY